VKWFFGVNARGEEWMYGFQTLRIGVEQYKV
jgi:hypothetical protein